jgi:hypothetical protein
MEGLGFHGEAWGSFGEAWGFLRGEMMFLWVLWGSLGRLGVHWEGLGFFREAWGYLWLLGNPKGDLGFLRVPRVPLEGLWFLGEAWGSLGEN